MIHQVHSWVYISPKELKAGILRYAHLGSYAVLFTTTKRWKQSKCPSMDEWINKMWSMHTMEYYSALKRNGTLIYVTTWMKLEDIILSAIRQWQKYKYYMILLI